MSNTKLPGNPEEENPETRNSNTQETKSNKPGLIRRFINRHPVIATSIALGGGLAATGAITEGTMSHYSQSAVESLKDVQIHYENLGNNTHKLTFSRPLGRFEAGEVIRRTMKEHGITYALNVEYKNASGEDRKGDYLPPITFGQTTEIVITAGTDKQNP